MAWGAIIGAVLGAAGGAVESEQGRKSTPDAQSFFQKRLDQELGNFLREQIYQTRTGPGGRRTNHLRGATQYKGDFLAPLLPQFGNALDLMNVYNPVPGLGSGANLQLNKFISGKPSYQAKLDPTSTSKFFNQAVQAPAYHTWNTKVLPQINEAFAGVGAFSSRQGQATGQALSDMQVGLDSQLGQMQLSNQQMQEQLNASLAESAASRSMSAINFQHQMDLDSTRNEVGQRQDAAQMMAQIGQYLQSRNDAGTQAGYNDFLRTAQENNPFLQLMMQYMGQGRGGTVAAPNYLGNIAGGAAGGVKFGKEISTALKEK